jgi:hypothetical protein
MLDFERRKFKKTLAVTFKKKSEHKLKMIKN